MSAGISLQLRALATRYAADPSSAETVLRDVHRRASESPGEIWIHRIPLDDLLAELRRVEERRARGDELPLFGVPFAVKDNIDLAGLPTTAACPAFAYVPARSAEVVLRLTRAGAIVIGKTNLDQFATGLVGVRSPYGACKNPFDARYITGGSSSGSAVAVATGLVSFALGTDTAGSGRVPAALNNIVGCKPSRGALSARGVVPACRTLDTVSIFAASALDARAVLDVCAAFDPEDPFSREVQIARSGMFSGQFRIGTPRPSEMEFFGDADAARLYEESLTRFESLGGVRVEIALEPFLAAARLLYSGPWVAERLHAAGALLETAPDAIHPIVRKILEGARGLSARDAFEGQYRLAEYRRQTEAEWKKMDVLVLPTTPTTYTITEIDEEPLERNARLGRYTNFVNLLDLAAVAVPAGFRKDGLPLGVSVIGRADSDRSLLELGARFHALAAPTVGATGEPVAEGATPPPASPDEILLVVAGAHLSGQPLNHQLKGRAARLVQAGRTSRHYRLYALSGTQPPKPGLVFDPAFEGTGIEIEVWAMSAAAFGSFVDEVPPPLAIGTVVLEDGALVNGFVCEGHALAHATEITHFGGWRRYRASLA